MSTRRIYDVAPRGDRWAVKERGGARAIGVFDDKSAAVARAAQVARRHRESQIVIRRQDGTIQDERTYGNDPFPPKG